jgi:hypothetical protein
MVKGFTNAMSYACNDWRFAVTRKGYLGHGAAACGTGGYSVLFSVRYTTKNSSAAEQRTVRERQCSIWLARALFMGS